VYWADGPVYRIDSIERTIYYRAAGVYPTVPELPKCECGALNTTQSLSGAVCMGCFSERRRHRETPPVPSVPKFTKADAAKILGVKWPGATREEVVDAYRALVLEAHADHGGTNERLIEILRARDRMLGTTKQVPR
jgi:hypothetical protein